MRSDEYGTFGLAWKSPPDLARDRLHDPIDFRPADAECENVALCTISGMLRQ
jgi:hypothetical protein